MALEKLRLSLDITRNPLVLLDPSAVASLRRARSLRWDISYGDYGLLECFVSMALSIYGQVPNFYVGTPGPHSGSIPDRRENPTDKSAPAPREESEVAVV